MYYTLLLRKRCMPSVSVFTIVFFGAKQYSCKNSNRPWILLDAKIEIDHVRNIPNEYNKLAQ